MAVFGSLCTAGSKRGQNVLLRGAGTVPGGRPGRTSPDSMVGGDADFRQPQGNKVQFEARVS